MLPFGSYRKEGSAGLKPVRERGGGPIRGVLQSRGEKEAARKKKEKRPKSTHKKLKKGDTGNKEGGGGKKKRVLLCVTRIRGPKKSNQPVG